jgi:tRNA/rRNA methyltransferase
MSATALRVILVRPKSSGNVGSVARAMKNFGVGELVVVAPRRFRRFSAEAMAVHGRDVLDAIAEEIRAVAAKNRVALVFGPEDTGLANEELALCHELVTIPTDPEYASLNLAQAVLLCLYEIHVAARPARAEPALATAERLELLFGKLREALLAIGFLPEENPEHILFALRRTFGRARLDEREVRIWLGIARQIEWFAGGGREVLAGKKREGKRIR